MDRLLYQSVPTEQPTTATTTTTMASTRPSSAYSAPHPTQAYVFHCCRCGSGAWPFTEHSQCPTCGHSRCGVCSVSAADQGTAVTARSSTSRYGASGLGRGSYRSAAEQAYCCDCGQGPWELGMDSDCGRCGHALDACCSAAAM
jgi:hypothetical protein